MTFPTLRITYCAFSCLFICVGADSPGQEADIVRPVRIARVNGAHGQVQEGPIPSEMKWVLLHQLGLKVVNVETGAETDVLKVPLEDRWLSGTHRLLTPDAKFFGVIAPGEQIATIRRVADGSTLVELDSLELFNKRNRTDHFMLAGDATYLLGIVRKSRARSDLVRVDFVPTPQVTVSHDLGPLAHHIYATPDPSGIVCVVPSDDTGRAPSARSLQVFDHQLQLLHKEKAIGPNIIVAAINLQTPAIAIRSLAGEHGIRFRGQPHWMWGELVRGANGATKSHKSALVPRLTANEWIMTAAFSPDGKWLVTSRDEALPTLDIRSTATGQLHRKVHIEGGRHDLPGHQIILRMAFSQSGRYLSASDYSNAYLLDFQELVKSASSASDRREKSPVKPIAPDAIPRK